MENLRICKISTSFELFKGKLTKAKLIKAENEYKLIKKTREIKADNEYKLIKKTREKHKHNTTIYQPQLKMHLKFPGDTYASHAVHKGG